MSITLTERAAQEVKTIIQQQELPENVYLRVGVKGGGCSGFSYSLDLTENKEEQDEFVRRRTAPPPPGTDPVTANMMVVNSMLGPASRGPEVDLVRHWASHTPPETVKAAVKAVQSYPEADAVSGFRAISVPALLVAGEVDQVGHPAGMKRVAAMIANCQFAVVSGSGHYPWAENPAEFNGAFFSFLDRHFPAR